MRIVHVITRLIIGGAQENTLLSCRGQLQRGHDVHLVTGPERGPEGTMMAEARAIPGLQVEESPHMVRAVIPWLDWLAGRDLARRLRELQPDVVHTHSSKAGILGRCAAARACPKSLIVHTIHGLPFYHDQSSIVRGLYVWSERWAARRSDRLISVCDAMTEEALTFRIAPPGKFSTVYSGMDVEKFLHPDEPVARVRERYGLPAEALVIVKVARLFHRKGHDDVLRAFATVLRRHPTLHLLFVGDGVLRGHLERLARRLGLSPRLRWAGLVDPQRVPAIIHASDILVHASYREGLARVLPQALLCGRPVVSYDVGGAREVVHAGETGYVVQPGDWHGLARALDTLVSDRMMRSRMGERGRALCLEMFDHRKMVEQIEQIYAAGLKAKSK